MSEPQQRQRLLYVDHAYHETTQSVKFFTDLLASELDVSIHWYEEFYKCNLTVSQIHGHDYILFFEFLQSRFRICPNFSRSVFIPMYDNEWGSKWLWRRIAHYGISVISFSGKITDFALKHGVKRCLDVRFFPDPAEYCEMTGDPDILLFWERGQVTLNTLKALFNPGDFKKIILLRRPQPGLVHTVISAEDQQLYNIEIVESEYLPRDEYLEIVRPAGVVLAPRLKEGIGMSFLEAMAMRKCVIAHNDATMNEYIEHGRNGLLFDANAPVKISKNDILNVHKNLPVPADMYKRWLADRQKIIQFIRDSEKIDLSLAGLARDLLMYFAFIFEATFFRVSGAMGLKQSGRRGHLAQ